MSLVGETISIGETFIYALIPFGHYIYRISKLDGSTDHIWTLLIPYLNIFPFSLIPMFMMYFGAIGKGKVKSLWQIFNHKVIFPVIVRIVSFILINQNIGETEQDEFGGNMFMFIPSFIAIYVINLFDRYIECKTLDGNKALLTFVDTLHLNVYATYFLYLALIGEDYALSIKIPGLILWIVAFIHGQSVFNMANVNDPETYCNPNLVSTGNIIKLISSVFVIALPLLI